MSEPSGLVVVLGGARSGKSSYAEVLGRRHEAAGGAVSYLATAPIVDADMADRVARHRIDRPDGWRTIEEQTELVEAIEEAGTDLVIVDCLTLWVSNLMWRGDTDEDVIAAAHRAAELAAGRGAPTVVVSNEVGLGVHPETDLGRRYRDLLGRVNQQWAAVADRAILMVAGQALPLAHPDAL